jgi:hypothetical protein
LPTAAITEAIVEKRSWLGWIGLGLLNALGVAGGIFQYQSECVLISLIPGIGIISAAACVTAAIATTLLIAGSVDTVAGGVIAISGAMGSTTQNDKRDLFVDDLDKFNHYVNLTHWHKTMRQNGVNTTILDVDSAIYYTDGDSYYALNSTSIFQSVVGANMYVQHGTNASRIFTNLEADSKQLLKRADPYGNGFDDEYYTSGGGLKAQFCHPFGSSESVNPVNDWTTMNTLVNEVVGNGQTGNHRWITLGLTDRNHNDAEITNVEFEVESRGFGLNEEWSEEGICDYPED